MHIAYPKSGMRVYGSPGDSREEEQDGGQERQKDGRSGGVEEEAIVVGLIAGENLLARRSKG